MIWRSDVIVAGVILRRTRARRTKSELFLFELMITSIHWYLGRPCLRPRARQWRSHYKYRLICKWMVGTPPAVINKVINGVSDNALKTSSVRVEIENFDVCVQSGSWPRALRQRQCARSATARTKRPECSGLTGRCQLKRLEGRNVGPVYLSQHLMLNLAGPIPPLGPL